MARILFAALICACVTMVFSQSAAGAPYDYCDKVSASSLKVYPDKLVPGLWLVHDITNDWGRSFSREEEARLFANVLVTYEIAIYCTKKSASYHFMNYGLTATGVAPRAGALLKGEDCITFDTAALKMLWSDEESAFVITDGKVNLAESYYPKVDQEELLATIKKYGFNFRCRIHTTGHASNFLEYWKKSLTAVKLEKGPVPGGAEVPIVPNPAPARPKPALPPTDPTKDWVEVKFAPQPGPSSIAAVAGHTPRSGPAIVRLSDGTGRPARFQMFVRGIDNALWVSEYVAGKWGSWRSLGGSIRSVPSATSWDGNTAVVVARGADDGIWYRRERGGVWDEWRTLGGFIKGDPAVAALWTDDYRVFGIGGDDAVWLQRFDGEAPGDWLSLGPVESPFAGDIGFHVGVGALVLNRLKLRAFAVGKDNRLYVKTWWSTEGWEVNWSPVPINVRLTPSLYHTSDGGPLIVCLTGGDSLAALKLQSYSGPAPAKVAASAVLDIYVPGITGTAVMAGPGSFEFDVYATMSDKLYYRRFDERLLK